jgi:hypothetical protein
MRRRAVSRRMNMLANAKTESGMRPAMLIQTDRIPLSSGLRPVQPTQPHRVPREHRRGF